MASTILVTGCYKTYFLMTCLLLHSLKRLAPTLPLHVLDFGLDEAQRRFLETRCTVLDRPAELDANQHPFAYKAAMARYLRPVPWSSMVWMDGDMVAVGPIEASLSARLADMSRARTEVALCRDDAATIAGAFASGLPMQPYADALRARGIDRGSSYFNCGFFACRSPDYLQAWDQSAQSMPVHSMYDQNLFNLLLHERGPPTELSAAVWNLHGALLAQARAGEAEGRFAVMVGEERTLALHATSSRAEDVLTGSGLKLGGEQIEGYLKFCRNPVLRQVQDFIMRDFVAESIDDLRRAGVLTQATASA